MQIKLLAVLLTAAFTAAPAVFAQTTNDMVRVEVRPQTKSDSRDIPNSTAKTRTQESALQVILGGKPRSPETRVVKWYMFGKDEGSNGIKTLGSGEEALSLNASGQQTLTTKSATTTYTPDHTVTDRNDNNRNQPNNNRPNSRRVQGTGTRFFGYVVKVMDGNTVVGKASTGQSVEAEAK